MRLLSLLLLLCSVLRSVTAYASLSREEIAGVWRLSKPNEKDEVLLKLNEDGTFLQIGSEAEIEKKKGQMGRWLEQAQARGSDGKTVNKEDEGLRGSWDFVDQQKLVLASDRPPNTETDTLLSGNVVVRSAGRPIDKENTDSHLSVPKGEILRGRFMYPRSHPSFFLQPMHKPKPTGTFVLRQLLGILNTRQQADTKPKIARYHKQDFYGRRFLLTVSPLQPKISTTKRVWSKSERGYVEQTVGPQVDPLRPFDVRVMRIEFFANNTFTALGTNKILRGRYGTTGDEKSKLWFSVSLFGAGRSMKGSVFSEGQGLNHDDRRTYLGEIEAVTPEDNSGTDHLCVHGSVVYGSDFDEGARPLPVGTFVMREIQDDSDEEEEAEIDDDEAFQ